jgi:hypothetical protein
MKAVNHYIIVEKLKVEAKKVAGLILTENIVSGLLLIGIALFNMHEYVIIHNLLAYAFFGCATYNIINDKRYRYIGIAMIFFATLIPIITIFWYEVIALLCLALYGFLYSLKKLKIEIKKETNKLLKLTNEQ